MSSPWPSTRHLVPTGAGATPLRTLSATGLAPSTGRGAASASSISPAAPCLLPPGTAVQLPEPAQFVRIGPDDGVAVLVPARTQVSRPEPPPDLIPRHAQAPGQAHRPVLV